MTSLQHDTCFALATALVDMVRNCLREEELRDAHQSFYEAAKLAFETYEIKRDRMERRLHPSRN